MIPSKERKIKALIERGAGQIDLHDWRYIKPLIVQSGNLKDKVDIFYWSSKNKCGIQIPKELVEQFDEL